MVYTKTDLGRWVCLQRTQYQNKAKTMTEKRIQLLEQLDFRWRGVPDRKFMALMMIVFVLQSSLVFSSNILYLFFLQNQKIGRKRHQVVIQLNAALLLLS